jgi:hypothetical protein
LQPIGIDVTLFEAIQAKLRKRPRLQLRSPFKPVQKEVQVASPLIEAFELECDGKPEALQNFKRQFISCFEASGAHELEELILAEIERRPDSDLAVIALYFSCLRLNNLDRLLQVLGKKIETVMARLEELTVGTGAANAGKKGTQNDLKSALIRLDLLLDIYLSGDKDNRDFARDFIALPNARELTQRFLSFDKSDKYFGIASKFFKIVAEERQYRDLPEFSSKLQSKYGHGATGLIRILKLMHSAPSRSLPLAQDNDYVKLKNDYRIEIKRRIQETDFPALRLGDKLQIVSFLEREDSDTSSETLLAQSFANEEIETFKETGQYFNILERIIPGLSEELWQKYCSGASLNPGLLAALYRQKLRAGELGDALRLLKTSRDDWPVTLGVHASTCLLTRDFDLFYREIVPEWIEAPEASKASPAFFARLREAMTSYFDLKFVEGLNRYYSRVPRATARPDEKTGILVSLVSDARALRNYPVALLMEGKRNGWQIVHYDDRYIWENPDDPVNFQEGAPRCLSNEWTVDFADEKAIANGVNYWQGLFEHVRISLRRYHLDFSNPKIADHFRFRLEQADAALTRTTQLFQSLGNERPIKVLLNNTHVGPGYVVSTYAESLSSDWNVDIVNFKNGYETLHSGSALSHATTLAVENLTRSGVPYARMGTGRGFAEWFEAEERSRSAAQDPHSAGRPFKKSGNLSERQSQYLEKLGRFRDTGGKIYVLLGKVIFDLVEPTRGVAHESMKDWLNHTIQTLEGRDDIRLIIKPHPQELSNAVALYPAERLRNLIETSSDHVDILEPDFMPLNCLTPYVDLGLIWSGTSIADLATEGIPTAALSSIASRIIPFVSFQPESRSAYANLLHTFDPAQVDREHLRRQGQSYNRYLKSDLVSKPFCYTKRPLTNVNIWPNEFTAQDFENYIRDGDPVVSDLFKHML